MEWSDEEKKKEELNKMETNKPRDLFIAKLLSKLKQQQQLQQQRQHPENKTETAEDPEESWENLVSDEDLSALSLEPTGAEDLEPVRNLFRRLQSTPKYQRLLKERQQLPVFKHRASIVETLKRHRVVVVAGETGSGKSTQVPHFLLEDLLLNDCGARKCNIVCTQPRRISAVSLATRVCEELGCEGGPGGRVRLFSPSASERRAWTLLGSWELDSALVLITEYSNMLLCAIQRIGIILIWLWYISWSTVSESLVWNVSLRGSILCSEQKKRAS